MADRLLDLFRPPEGMHGHFGLITAYCASVGFLEDAASTFSGLGPRRRESYGKPFLLLLLDAHRTADRVELLRPNEVPGVFELPPRIDRHRELFHAKVGLLTFARTRTGPPAHVRLVVTTANWTQASACGQLELAWRLDLEVADEQVRGPWADRADLFETAHFIELALERFTAAAPFRARIDRLLALARSAPTEWAAKRFIHSLKPARDGGTNGTPLYDQIVARAPHDVPEPRDTVVCGSGFFEKPGRGTAKPEVLARIDDLPGLKAGTRIVLARPRDAGALARWRRDRDGWAICRAEDADGRAGRTLHAKFIYVARRWGRGTRDGWLYLGSGNLTRRGLLLAPGPAGRGNVEVGVVLPVVDGLDSDALAKRLFTTLDGEEIDVAELRVGPDEDDVLKEPLIAVPPILLVEEVLGRPAYGRALRLTWTDVEGAPVVLRWPGTDRVVVRGTTAIPLAGPCPAVITVVVDGRDMLVPVLDARGRFCHLPPSPESFADALADLLAFPVPPAEENGEDVEDDEDDDDDEDGVRTGRPVSHDAPQTYPLHEGMLLIERIAAHQAALAGEQLLDWFEHLESRLVGRFSQEQIAAWRDLQLPILETLRYSDFQPPDMTDEQTRGYRALLDRVAAAWSTPA